MNSNSTNSTSSPSSSNPNIPPQYVKLQSRQAEMLKKIAYKQEQFHAKNSQANTNSKPIEANDAATPETQMNSNSSPSFNYSALPPRALHNSQIPSNPINPNNTDFSSYINNLTADSNTVERQHDLLRQFRSAKADCARKDGMIQSLQAQIIQLSQENSELQHSSTELTQILRAQNTTEQSLHHTVAELRSQLTSSNQIESNLRAQITENQAKAINSERIFTIKLTELEGKLTNAQNSLEISNAAKKRLEYDNSVAAAQLDQLKSLHSELELKLHGAAIDHSAMFHEVSNERDNYQQQLQLLTADFSELANEFKLLKAEFDAQILEINALASSKTSQQKENERLQAELAQIKAEKIVLSTENSVIPKLQQEIYDLAAAKAELSRLGGLYNDAQTELTEKAATISTVNKSFEEMYNVCKDLTEKVGEANTKLQQNSEEISQLTQGNSQLRAEIECADEKIANLSEDSSKFQQTQQEISAESKKIGEFVREIAREVERSSENAGNFEFLQRRLLEDLKFKGNAAFPHFSELEAAFSDLSTSILLVFSQFLTLKQARKELNNTLIGEQSAVKTLQLQLAERSKEIDEISTRNAQSKQQNGQNLAEIEKLQREKAELAEEKGERDEVIENLARDLQDLLNLALVQPTSGENSSQIPAPRQRRSPATAEAQSNFSVLQSALSQACSNLQSRIQLILTDFLEAQHRLRAAENKINELTAQYEHGQALLQREIQNSTEIKEDYETQLNSAYTEQKELSHRLNNAEKYKTENSAAIQQLSTALRLIYRAYKPLHTKLHDLQFQKLFWAQRAHYFHRIQLQINETAQGLVKAQSNQVNYDERKRRISFRSAALTVVAALCWGKQAGKAEFYGKSVKVQGETVQILKSDAENFTTGAALELPPIDEGTASKAALSLSKLLAKLDADYAVAGDSHRLSLLQNLGIGYYRFQTRLQGLSLESNVKPRVIDSIADINVIRSAAFNLASRGRELETELDSLSSELNRFEEELRVAKNTISKQEETQQRAILTIQKLEQNIENYEENRPNFVALEEFRIACKHRDELEKLVHSLRAELIKKAEEQREKLLEIQKKNDKEVKQLNEIINSQQRETQISKEEIMTLTAFVKKKSNEITALERGRKNEIESNSELQRNLEQCIQKNKLLLNRAKHSEQQFNTINSIHRQLQAQFTEVENKWRMSEKAREEFAEQLSNREKEIGKCQDLIRSLTTAHRAAQARAVAAITEGAERSITAAVNSSNLFESKYSSSPAPSINLNPSTANNGTSSMGRLGELNSLAQSFLAQANANAVAAAANATPALNRNNNINPMNRNAVEGSNAVKIRHHGDGRLSVDISDTVQSASIVSNQGVHNYSLGKLTTSPPLAVRPAASSNQIPPTESKSIAIDPYTNPKDLFAASAPATAASNNNPNNFLNNSTTSYSALSHHNSVATPAAWR
jgi:chromosome segregation ATPase